MSTSRRNKLAIAYWQDSLAKFFPTSPGPTDVEMDMYRAGYAEGARQGTLRALASANASAAAASEEGGREEE